MHVPYPSQTNECKPHTHQHNTHNIQTHQYTPSHSHIHQPTLHIKPTHLSHPSSNTHDRLAIVEQLPSQNHTHYVPVASRRPRRCPSITMNPNDVILLNARGRAKSRIGELTVRYGMQWTLRIDAHKNKQNTRECDPRTGT